MNDTAFLAARRKADEVNAEINRRCNEQSGLSDDWRSKPGDTPVGAATLKAIRLDTFGKLMGWSN